MGLSLWHMLLLLGIALLFFGPSRLPTLGRSIGEAIRGFKKGLNGDEIDITPDSRNEQLKAGKTETSTNATKENVKEEHHS